MNDRTEDIGRILKDLFELDPELKTRESELRRTVERLLESRFAVSVDRDFVARLRRELLMPGAARVISDNYFIRIQNHMKKSILILGGSAVVAAALLIAVVVLIPGGTRPEVTGDRVLALGPNAFGSLSAGNGEMVTGQVAPESATTPAGLGGGGKPALGTDMSIGLPAPEYQPVSFRYAGDELTGLGQEVTVYRRVREMQTSALASSFAGRDNGLFALGGLSDPQMMNITMGFADGGKDYRVYLDFREGMAMINLEEEWSPELENLPVAQDLPDSEIISIADSFLDRYGVDRSAYGAPWVDGRWRGMLENGNPPQPPTYVSLVYPLTIEGGSVLDWNGDPYGMRVTVDAARKFTQGAYSIMSPRFESSAYPAEADASRILSLVEKGGFNGQVYLPEGTADVLELGTPSLHYFQHYVYADKLGSPSELYVPALFFPILNPPEELGIYHRYVIVPLAKEILDQREESIIGGGDMPRPLTEPAVLDLPVKSE